MQFSKRDVVLGCKEQPSSWKDLGGSVREPKVLDSYVPFFPRQILCQDSCCTLGWSHDTTETVKVDGKLKKE